MNDARTGAPVDQTRIWEFLTALRGRRGQLFASELAVALDQDNPPCLVPNDDSRATLRLQSDGGWISDLRLTPEAAMFLDLYLPVALAGPQRPIAIAHLGQSLDGRIATESGASHYVTGPENIDQPASLTRALRCRGGGGRDGGRRQPAPHHAACRR